MAFAKLMAGNTAAKKRKLDPVPDNATLPLPRSMVAWNVNGLRARLEENGTSDDITDFIRQHNPDLITLTEVKFGASHTHQHGIRRHIVADKAPSNSNKTDKALIDRELLTGVFKDYVATWSLSDTRYAGTAILRKRQVKAPTSKRFNLLEDDPTLHTPEGRVVIFEYDEQGPGPGLTIMTTYVPNNGSKVKRLLERQAWDRDVTAFVAAKKAAGRPLIYGGDLNATRGDIDMSHPAFFQTGIGESLSGYKGWKNPEDESLNEGDRGQPACTPNEQTRFNAMLNYGGLVDTYRARNPEQPNDYDGPVLTWRGAPSYTESVASYSGKGMRIDYWLVSADLYDQVETVEICGKGKKRDDFMGSDHCPLLLKMKMEWMTP